MSEITLTAVKRGKGRSDSEYGRSARGPVLSKNPFRFPLKAPNGDYSAVIIPEAHGALACAPAHLQPYRESTFVNTNTHTMFSLYPPDGESKLSLKAKSDHSPVKYRGTMLSDTSNRLPPEIIVKQDTRLAHVFNPPKEYIPGPGEILWEKALGGQSLGPYYNLTKSSVSRSPGRDPERPSQAFLATRRPDPTSPNMSAAPDIVYSPAAPNFNTWLSSGFASTSNLREIKAETWGNNPREPRDPHATPGPKEFPVLGKCGLPYDISAQARPHTASGPSADVGQTASHTGHHSNTLFKSRGVHTAPASPTYGRRNVAHLKRHPGRDVRPGMRTTVKCPYTRPEEMSPGASFPWLNFNAPSRVARATHANRTYAHGYRSQPSVHVRAVGEVQQLKCELQHHQMLAQQRLSLKACTRDNTPEQPCTPGYEVPLEVRHMEVLQRVGLCNA